MSIVTLIRQLQNEFAAMPGLRLTERQVERLCHVSASSSASALRALVSAGYLHAFEDGSYGRADIAVSAAVPFASGTLTAVNEQ